MSPKAKREASPQQSNLNLKLRLAMAAAMAVVFVLSWFSRPLWTSGNENLELWAVTVLENSGDSARLCGEWGKITVRFQGEVPELVTGETYRLYLHRHALCEVEVWSYERIAGPVCNEAGKEQL